MGRELRVVVAVALLASGFAARRAGAETPIPSIRLVATETSQDVQRFDGESIFIDPGVWVASAHGAFELRAKRRRYSDPVTLTQVDATTRDVLRRLPSSLLDGWNGLANFFQVTVRDDAGAVVLDRSSTFCPASYNVNRFSNNGPASPRYPESCESSPFTKGAVWGIDRGWAVDPFTSIEGDSFDGPDGHYTVTVTIEPPYLHMFGVPGGASTATVGLNVTTYPSGPSAAASRTAPAPPRGGSVPTITDPDPSTLPELASLPAWNFSTATDTATGDDLLQFAATEWNAGTQPMVVEGYRRPGTDIMDAYQYFYRAGRPIGRARVGTMTFDADFGHDHWHFKQFARYSLLDANKQLVQPSAKDGFCLAPTDPIDMTVAGAEWRPYSIGLSTACGDASSLWVREVLPAGWGDTYVQYIAGQSFDISGLPNGTYYVRIQVNPLHKLYERSPANDTRLREVILGGSPGARTVSVPPWHGLDTG